MKTLEDDEQMQVARCKMQDGFSACLLETLVPAS